MENSNIRFKEGDWVRVGDRKPPWQIREIVDDIAYGGIPPNLRGQAWRLDRLTKYEKPKTLTEKELVAIMTAFLDPKNQCKKAVLAKVFVMRWVIASGIQLPDLIDPEDVPWCIKTIKK